MSQAKTAGAIIYGTEFANNLIYYWTEVTQLQQQEIDDYVKDLVSASDPAEIVGLPLSTLTVGEVNKIEIIMGHRIGNL